MTQNLSPAQSLHIIYTSRLGPGADYTVYADVCRVARPRNAAAGVSGVLLFDGQRFCQWLYGAVQTTDTLMAQIAQDSRHAGVSECLRTLMPTVAFGAGWRSGFVDSDALDRFELQRPRQADQVLSAFGRLLAVADIQPAVADGQGQWLTAGAAGGVSKLRG